MRLRGFLNKQLEQWIATPYNAGDKVELVNYPFHHIRRLSAGAQATDISFFNVAPGQTEGGVVLTKEDVNMFKAGTVGIPYKYFIQDVGIAILPAIADAAPEVDTLANVKKRLNDAKLLMSRGSISISTLSKEYLNISPISRLPSGFGLFGEGVGSIAATDNVGSYANGWPMLSNVFPVEIPLSGETTFEVHLTFPAGAVTLGADMRLGLFLGGILQRPAV